MDDMPTSHTAAALPEGDKRWAAVMALDLVGFSALTQSLGQEKVFDLLQEVLQTARSIVERCGGHIVDTAGDGILAAFGAPTAMENASLQTCRAADLILTEITTNAQALRQRFGLVPELRIGIAGGGVMVARGPNETIKLVGDPVNLAARLQALAVPNAILVTDSIQREVAGQVTTTDAQEVTLKGFTDPVRVHRLGAVLQTPTRFDGTRKRGLGAFVSRAAEFGQAKRVFDDTAEARILLLSGVAGIGKSRLLFELVREIGATRPVHIAQCSPDNVGRPLSPADMLIRSASGQDEGATLRTHLEALRDAVPGCCDNSGITRFTAPRATEKDPVGRLLHDRDFLRTLLARLAAGTDAIFVFEDVHWVDPATADLLEGLITDGTPAILTTRDATAIPKNDTILHIALRPMEGADIAAIFGAQIAQPLSTSLVTRVIQGAEGIPLVAEEFAHAIRDSDHLVETEAGLDLKDGSGAILSGNLQQLVLSRVDRLPEVQRKSLQVASAIGRDFSWSLLQRVLGEPDSIPDTEPFDGIVDVLDARTGRFSHALIREAVYTGLLSSQRKDIHRRIAAVLEADPTLATRANLADHYVQADMRPQAARTLIEAADEALQVYDLHQVDDRLTIAFEYVTEDPTLLDDAAFGTLCHLWMRALAVGSRYRHMLKVSADFLPRLTQSAYMTESAVARALIALARTGARDYAGARDLALEAVADAEAHNDPHGAAWAKATLARVYDETTWEDQDTVQRLCREIVPVAEAVDDRLLSMTAQYLLVASYRACGRRLEALATADAIEVMADKYQDRRARGYANWARAIVHSIGGDPEAAAAIAKIAKQDVLSQSSDRLVVEGIETFTQVYTDPPDQVRLRIEHNRAIAVSILDYNLIHSADWIRSVLELRAGNLALGWRMACENIPVFQKAGNMNIVRQAYILRAEVLLTIAGLINPDAEAPPERPKYDRPKPSLADIATFVRLKLQAKRLAKQDLEECIALDPQKRGAHFARAQIGLGLIALARRQKDRAREHLERGLKHASDEGVDVLCARAKAGLAQL